MTNQEFLEQIIHLPIAERIEIIERVSRSVRENLSKTKNEDSKFAERSAAINRLRGIAKSDNPSITGEDERKIIEDALMEKYSS
jgi:hypothetical protein